MSEATTTKKKILLQIYDVEDRTIYLEEFIFLPGDTPTDSREDIVSAVTLATKLDLNDIPDVAKWQAVVHPGRWDMEGNCILPLDPEEGERRDGN